MPEGAIPNQSTTPVANVQRQPSDQQERVLHQMVVDENRVYDDNLQGTHPPVESVRDAYASVTVYTPGSHTVASHFHFHLSGVVPINLTWTTSISRVLSGTATRIRDIQETHHVLHTRGTTSVPVHSPYPSYTCTRDNEGENNIPTSGSPEIIVWSNIQYMLRKHYRYIYVFLK